MSQLEVDKIIPQSGTTLTIGDSGDTVNFADGTALSIDTNTLYIDSTNNRVGIGTTSPSTKLHVYSGNSGVTPNANADDLFIENNGAAGITIGSSTSEKGNIFFADSGNALDGYIQYAHDSRYLRFATATLERMRIDSSGRLIVNSTSSIFTNAKIQAVHSSGPTLGIKQTTGTQSAGGFWNSSTDTSVKVISVYAGANGNEYGTIGVNSSDNLFIGGNLSNHSGIEFSTSAVLPRNNNTLSSNSVDLGNSSVLWQDAYLSGGLYVGGTGTANKLDDYEEGTWTPSYGFSGGSVTMSSQEGHYVKIGKLVIATVGMSTSALSSPSGQARINGLPFTKEEISESGFSNGLVYRWGTNFNNFGTVVIDSTNYALMYTSAFNQTQTNVVESSDFITGTGNNRIIGVITYYTTA